MIFAAVIIQDLTIINTCIVITSINHWHHHHSDHQLIMYLSLCLLKLSSLNDVQVQRDRLVKEVEELTTKCQQIEAQLTSEKRHVTDLERQVSCYNKNWKAFVESASCFVWCNIDWCICYQATTTTTTTTTTFKCPKIICDKLWKKYLKLNE